MRNLKKSIFCLSLIVVFLVNSLALAQDDPWKVQLAKQDSVQVKSKISGSRENRRIHYVATATTNKVSLDQIESYLRETKNHKNFMENCLISKQISTIDTNHWIAYYVYKTPWPMPKNDVVQELLLNRLPNQLTITGTSAADQYPDQKLSRMQHCDIEYIFIEQPSGQIDISISAKFEPIGLIPNFILKTWFPEGPARIVRNLTQGAVDE